MSKLLMPHRAALFATLVIFAASIAMLFAMDRPPICECGSVKLWHGVVQSAENSQHITDWYSPSHFIHGMIMYGLAWMLWVRLPEWKPALSALAKVAVWALPIAIALEAAWEISENTQTVIDRYREMTISWGYSGDSILNSASDIGWMIIGFFVAARLPWKASAGLAVFLESLALYAIRDNLALNVLMLFWPIEAVAQWQGMG